MIFSDHVLLAFCMIESGAALFLLIYYIITLTDLECDYINGWECCTALNRLVLVKLGAQVLITVLLIIHFKWGLFLTAVPVAAMMIYEYVTKLPGSLGVYDPVEIFNHGRLKKHMRDSLIQLGYNLLAFFLYLYCLVIAMLKDRPPMQGDSSTE